MIPNAPPSPPNPRVANNFTLALLQPQPLESPRVETHSIAATLLAPIESQTKEAMNMCDTTATQVAIVGLPTMMLMSPLGTETSLIAELSQKMESPQLVTKIR